jgi:hypothetical protein
MAKTLKQILDGVKSSKTKNKDILGTKPGVDYSPKAGDERKFADKHEIEKHADRVGNGDDVYQGTNVKYSMDTPQMKNFGNTESEAEAAYEEAKCNMTKEGVKCPVHGMASCVKSHVIKEKPVKEEKLDEVTKTTHENPLVSVYDKDGLHTHANLSTVNSIHNTNVKHTDVHKGAVTTKSGWDNKPLRFELSPHHIAHMAKDTNEETVNELLVQNYVAGSKGRSAEVHKNMNAGNYTVKKMVGNKLVSSSEYEDPSAAHTAAKKHINEEAELNEGHLIARKTVMNQRGGEDQYELHHHGHGKTAWHSIIKTHQDGKPTMNEYGGHSPVHVGSEKYVKRHWNNIKSQKLLPADHPFRMKEEVELDEKAIAKGKQTVLVTMKSDPHSKSGGATKRIKKSEYNPKIHNLAEDQEQIDEISLGKAIKTYAHAASAGDYGMTDKTFSQHDRLMGHIKRKFGDKAASHADDAAHTAYYGRGTPRPGQDKLSSNLTSDTMRKTKSGMLNKQDLAKKKREIKDRMSEDIEQITEIEERKMSDAEMDKREHIVKGMKKKLGDFRARYGKRAKDVMYATATKQAMKEEKVTNPVTGHYMRDGGDAYEEGHFVGRHGHRATNPFPKNHPHHDRFKDGVKDGLKSKKEVKEDLAQPLIGSTQPRGNSEEAADMVRTELRALANKAMHLVMNMPNGMHVEPWVQAKIAQAKEMVSSVHDYMIYGDHKEEDEQAPAVTPSTFPNYNVDPGASGTGQNI